MLPVVLYPSWALVCPVILSCCTASCDRCASSSPVDSVNSIIGHAPVGPTSPFSGCASFEVGSLVFFLVIVLIVFSRAGFLYLSHLPGHCCLFCGPLCPFYFVFSCCLPFSPSLCPKRFLTAHFLSLLSLLEGGPFWIGSLVLLPFLPGSPNPFYVLPKGFSNPFEERVQESSPTGSPDEVNLFLCKKFKELTTCNLLAMQVDELKKQLECAGCLPKRFCKGSA